MMNLINFGIVDKIMNILTFFDKSMEKLQKIVCTQLHAVLHNNRLRLEIPNMMNLFDFDIVAKIMTLLG